MRLTRRMAMVEQVPPQPDDLYFEYIFEQLLRLTLLVFGDSSSLAGQPHGTPQA